MTPASNIPHVDWFCEIVSLVPPTAVFVTSGGLGVSLPIWVAPVAALGSFLAGRLLLACIPTQVLGRLQGPAVEPPQQQQ